MTDGELKAHLAMMKLTYDSTLPNLTKQLRTVSSEHQTQLRELQQQLKTALAATQEQQQRKTDSLRVGGESEKEVAQLLELRTTQLRTSIEAQYSFKTKNDELKRDLTRLEEQVAVLKHGLADQVFAHHICSHDACSYCLREKLGLFADVCSQPGRSKFPGGLFEERAPAISRAGGRPQE